MFYAIRPRARACMNIKHFVSCYIYYISVCVINNNTFSYSVRIKAIMHGAVLITRCVGGHMLVVCLCVSVCLSVISESAHLDVLAVRYSGYSLHTPSY